MLNLDIYTFKKANFFLNICADVALHVTFLGKGLDEECGRRLGGGGSELPTLEWVSQQPMCVRVCACIVNVN